MIASLHSILLMLGRPDPLPRLPQRGGYTRLVPQMNSDSMDYYTHVWALLMDWAMLLGVILAGL